MVAAITPTADIPRRRVDVALSGWVTDGPVEVYGIHGDTRWLVRSITDVIGGVTTGWDYEAPLGVAVVYAAMDGATLVSSAGVVLDVDVHMLRAPGLPGFDLEVTVVEAPQVNRPRPVNVLRPLGRRTPIVQTGTLSAGEWDLRVRTRTDADAVALESLLAEAGTVLLLMPGTRLARQYVATGGVSEDPMVYYRARTSAVDDVGRWAEWVIPCVVVDQPVGHMFGDPTTSWDAVKATYASWDALKAAKATWLDVLRGI